MKKIQDFNFNGQNVLVRCDFNVPLSESGEVLDDFRIRMALPTIEYLIEQKARVILMSHSETKEKKFSLKLLVPKLEELLSHKVVFLSDYLKENTREKIDEIDPSQIILLENLRFHKEEKENDKIFAKKISELGDIFINEAFSSCHRKHASIVGVPNYLPGAAGLLLEKEIKVFSDLLKESHRPFLVILGGIKLETKIKTILNILETVDYLIIGSKIGEVFFIKKGLLPQRNLPEEKLLEKIDLENPKIYLPPDGIICSKSLEDKFLREGKVETLKSGEGVFDIGTESINIFKELIEKSKTILWNGALGMYEDKRFEKGTKEIAKAIAVNSSAFKVAGGGETISAIKEFNLTEGFSFLSTGGGAMLEFLSGENLPGVEALKQNGN